MSSRQFDHDLDDVRDVNFTSAGVERCDDVGRISLSVLGFAEERTERTERTEKTGNETSINEL